jgi:hypothetical protein
MCPSLLPATCFMHAVYIRELRSLLVLYAINMLFILSTGGRQKAKPKFGLYRLFKT